MRIIDADGHVLEHPTAMLQYAPAQVSRSHLPSRDACRTAARWCTTPATPPARTTSPSPAPAACRRKSACAPPPGKLKYTEIKPGAFDPRARLEEVAIDDIQQSVVYPTLMLGLPGFPDAEFADVQASAYNRWVAEYCRYAPTRLFGVGVIPHQDVDRSLAVIKEAQ